MRVNDIWGLLGAFVTVALVTTLVSSPNTGPIFTAAGTTFTGALKAAQGK